MPQATSEADRMGRMFNVPGCLHTVSKTISAIGENAGVKVSTDPRTGKVKYASAHDFRRSFGERWASRVMPPILQQLMRHASIETTLRFYVGQNAEKAADVIWQAAGQQSPVAAPESSGVTIG